MKVLIAGDFAPIGRIRQLSVEGNYDAFLSDVRSLTGAVDYSIVNLEAPLENDLPSVPVSKHGPVLKSHPSALKALKWCGFDCLTLANNHIMDLGPEALNATVEMSRAEGLDTVGAGADITVASGVLYKTFESGTLAVINCCEREFSIAGKTTPGANPLEAVHIYKEIKEASAKADFTLVIIHGGIEHYQLPSPGMCELYRFFIEAGADAVVNHHQHCFSGYEIVGGKPVFYGLGNFCFDLPGDKDEKWFEGYMVELCFEKGKDPAFRVIPYIQNRQSPGITLSDSDRFFSKLKALNDIIADESELERKYEAFMEENSKPYLYALTPYSGRLGAALYFHGFLPDVLPKGKLRMVQDYISCSSHRDRFIHALEKKTK